MPLKSINISFEFWQNLHPFNYHPFDSLREGPLFVTLLAKITYKSLERGGKWEIIKGM
jgi:hypothetical protein